MACARVSNVGHIWVEPSTGKGKVDLYISVTRDTQTDVLLCQLKARRLSCSLVSHFVCACVSVVR
eukprot:1281599-Pleurochrysis_carterae.AAC.1